jgi:anti-anti-sigma regulatory factor
MYKIEKRPSGYILTFAGNINADEMQNWYDDSQKALRAETSSSFGVIIDMKDLLPLSSAAKDIMVGGQQLYKVKGMKKSAVLLNSSVIALQFKNIAKTSGIYATERYIDASSVPNAIKVAVDWVKDGIDPDL